MEENIKTLNYKIIGKGKPVVFLHGFLESISMWDVLPLEGMPFQSILLDLPGHGDSKDLPEEVSIRMMAEVAANTLEKLNIESYEIVGHSMGGYVGLEMAKANHNVEALCLMNSSFWADSPKKKADRNRVIEVVRENKNRFLNEAIPGLFADPEAHADFIKDLLDEAREITVDAIVYSTAAMRDRDENEQVCMRLGERLKIVQGEKDKSIPLEDMLENTQEKDMNLTILPDVAHMSHVEATDKLRAILAEFL